MGFTAAELAEIAAADAEIEASFRLEQADLDLSLELDRLSRFEALPPEKQRLAAHQKAYYEANKEKLAAHQKAYYESNKEKLAAYQKAYYEANREKLAAHQKAYREANRERYNAYMREYARKKREGTICQG